VSAKNFVDLDPRTDAFAVRTSLISILNSHDASIIAGDLVPFQMRHGNCDITIPNMHLKWYCGKPNCWLLLSSLGLHTNVISTDGFVPRVTISSDVSVLHLYW